MELKSTQYIKTWTVFDTFLFLFLLFIQYTCGVLELAMSKDGVVKESRRSAFCSLINMRGNDISTSFKLLIENEGYWLG